MALEAGARVGAYEIVAKLGSGGMSEVYRARDLTLGREVALKLLPESWGSDPERVARFQREAQILAALNHPNIAVIHRLERDSGRTFLVLELIPGETLEERIAKGPLSFDEARRIFLQIALALEAAHGKGIIHRDLKPANAQINPEGTVKLLDFGLSKDVRPSSSSTATATWEGGGTSEGIVLGTPPYMSPEQARGRAVAKTTDIWSFGVMLFEALTAKSPFARETMPDTIAAVLNDEPPWSALPRAVPGGIVVLLKRCLRKDERQRLHDIADARLEIEEASEDVATSTSTSRWGVPLAAAIAAFVLGILYLSPRSQERSRAVRRFVIDLPAVAPLSLANGGSLAVSPDGLRLAYIARSGDRAQLYLRTLDRLDVVPIPGTEGAESAVFAPTGNAVAFFSGGKLRTLELPGGSASTLADAPSPRGIVWIAGAEDSILFSPSSSGGLALAPARGGLSHAVAELGDALAHRWPAALPGGDNALITRWTKDGFDVAALDLSSGETSVLVPNASQPRYAPSGHLLFARGSELYAAPFDPRSRRLTSEPSVVLEDVASDPNTGAAFYDVSRDGDLFYVRGADSGTEGGRATALLVDGRGNATPLGPPRPSLQVPRLSPDGRKLVATVSEGTTADLWALDLERGAWTRLTLTGDNGASVFAPDGRTLAFSSSRDGVFSIYSTPADGSGGLAPLTRAEHPRFPTSISPDGEWLAYTELHPETGFDVHVVSLPDGRRRTLAATSFEEAGAVFSPDGKYVAYTSNESGRDEVYVRRFSGPEGRWQVSTDSGAEPVWSRDGSRLYFRSASSLAAADVRLDPDFHASAPRVLFEAPFDKAGGLYANYDVTRDGENFVMIRSEKERTARSIHVVLNWFVELEGRVRVSR